MPCISVVFRDASDKESLKETFQAVYPPPTHGTAGSQPGETFYYSIRQLVYLFAAINSIFFLCSFARSNDVYTVLVYIYWLTYMSVCE